MPATGNLYANAFIGTIAFSNAVQVSYRGDAELHARFIRELRAQAGPDAWVPVFDVEKGACGMIVGCFVARAHLASSQCAAFN